MDKYAIIVAGGSGSRMGSAIPKQFLVLGSKPVFMHSVTAFLEAFPDLIIVLVLPEAYVETGREQMQQTAPDRFIVTAGGATRFHSVKNGLAYVPGHSISFVHDAVRCLVTGSLVERCYKAAAEYGNAVPAIAATDSLRLLTAPGISQVLDRSKVQLIQTPQTFLSSQLKSAFSQAYDPAFTDEASVAEKCGIRIHLIEGEPTNLKITTPLDLLIAEIILEQRAV